MPKSAHHHDPSYTLSYVPPNPSPSPAGPSRPRSKGTRINAIIIHRYSPVQTPRRHCAHKAVCASPQRKSKPRRGPSYSARSPREKSATRRSEFARSDDDGACPCLVDPSASPCIQELRSGPAASQPTLSSHEHFRNISVSHHDRQRQPGKRR
ncbi:hypothetical protein K505DRAFT_160876 [Melanomma pulvis-pyrius CBS 109.77]|uniref:Uncharacterized protein n=1 Tax=Melanomma pulvis-pyrius CBS 109.77 TaxID=1314802 RepID=A0A6A6XK16_9PLEO|nr:hypothetical protein K505DRAFT_160876 [Melanomma pulvis-pyrius CBS 109.77]